MRKFLGVCALIALVILLGGYLYTSTSWVLPWQSGETEARAVVRNKQIYLNEDGQEVPFHVRGVDLGAGIPGHFATEFAIDYDTYMEWFHLISEMNANTIRVYTILGPDFYRAFYDYNVNNPEPLYLIHGVWVDDDVMRAHNDAFVDPFREVFKEDCRKLVDVLHGQRTIQYNSRYGSGAYRYDVSPWVLGYILGVEWEPDIVLYTDDIREEQAGYEGEYLYTAPEATAFETMLAQVGDALYAYETRKYGQQRLVAFSNWPETDPLEHSVWRVEQATNLVGIDVEHILAKDSVTSGMFASYHIYPYYPLFLDFEATYSEYIDEDGVNNPYRAYLSAINEHHTIPVIISEFGIPSSRGVARINPARGMNQGNMSEAQQAEALPVLYEDIMKSGCAGAVVFAWQDEWFKRTWNTWPGVDLTRNAYWSDYQTNEQFFGLVTFDPGEEKSICYVDGVLDDWQDVPVLAENGDMSLKMQYDEKFIYFQVHAQGYDPDGDKLFIPIDLTPKSGALTDASNDLSFERPVDFVIVLDGKEDSKVMVQEYYDLLYSTMRREIWQEDAFIYPSEKDSSVFRNIYQYLRGRIPLVGGQVTDPVLFPTGELRHGNANPEAEDYDSLADFLIEGDDIEIRIPWALLNFSDPSEMQIHDDYYLHYGVDNLQINELYAGLMRRTGDDVEDTGLKRLALRGWGDHPTAHLRLKQSYYAMQQAFQQHKDQEGS